MAVGGGTVRVDNVEVTGFSNIMGDVFGASGQGSQVIVSNSIFMDNDMRPTPSTWSGVRAIMGARVTVTNTNFVDNHQMRSAVAVEGGAVGTINGVIVETASGTLTVDNNVSSVIFVNGDARADITSVEFEDVSSFTVSKVLQPKVVARPDLVNAFLDR